jgi:hypothetical protein
MQKEQAVWFVVDSNCIIAGVEVLEGVRTRKHSLASVSKVQHSGIGGISNEPRSCNSLSVSLVNSVEYSGGYAYVEMTYQVLPVIGASA